MSTAPAGAAPQVTITPVISDAALHIIGFACGEDFRGRAAAAVQFRDDDPNGTTRQYSATIAWGDGTTTTVASSGFYGCGTAASPPAACTSTDGRAPLPS